MVPAGRSAEELHPRRDASPTVHIDIDISIEISIEVSIKGGEERMSMA